MLLAVVTSISVLTGDAIREIILFVKKERRNLAAHTNSVHFKWQNHMVNKTQIRDDMNTFG